MIGMDLVAPINPDDYSDDMHHMSYDEWDLARMLFVSDSLDWHVRYYGLPGFQLIYYVHSSIEYVYATPETIERVNNVAEEEE